MPFNPPLTLVEVQAAFQGKFQITESIAAGGQGAVFKAKTDGAGGASDEVALKVYFEEQVEERSTREVSALRGLNCPTMVRLNDEGRCVLRGNPAIFIATSFIDGESLAATIARGPMSPPDVARIGHDIALAIDHLWAARIVHRDIKPGNIMMARSGGAVLIDLGLAKHLSLSPLTSVGKTWGTEGYLSPEHARGATLSCKSDMFALGIVLQEALLGRHPTARRQLSLAQGGPRTGGLRSGLPSALITLVDAMVHKSAVYRPMPSAVVQKCQHLLNSSS